MKLRNISEDGYSIFGDETSEESYALAQTRDIILACYEKPGEFCHLHLVADWLTENGFETHEWQ